MYQIVPVFQQMCAWQWCKSGLQFTVRSGRINEQHIEPEQAGKCNKNQDYISDKSSCMDSKSFFQIFIFVLKFFNDLFILGNIELVVPVFDLRDYIV